MERVKGAWYYVFYLMWISVYDRLFLELELAWVIATALDAHGAIMVTIDFT